MRRTLPRLVVLLAIVSLAALPASAAPKGTWWVALDGIFAQPSGLDLDVAFDEDPLRGSGSDLFGIEFGPEFSGRIRGGWRDADDSKNAYSISYWSWDHDESLRDNRGVYPVVSDPFFANGFALRAESGANIKASVLDLMITRRLGGSKRSTWTWGVGLRHASFEENWDIAYFDDPNFLVGLPPSGRDETIGIDVKSTGLGMTGGMGAVYAWHPRWRTAFRAQVSLLKGSTDAEYVDRGFDAFTSLFFTTGIDREGDERMFQQLELEARVVFNVWKTLDVSAGWWLMNWSDAGQTDRFFDDVRGTGGPGFSKDDLGFDGLFLGVSYSFE